MSDDKSHRRRLKRRMKAIADQAAFERKLREPKPEPVPPRAEPEIIDMPGLVVAPPRLDGRLATLIECARIAARYGGLP